MIAPKRSIESKLTLGLSQALRSLWLLVVTLFVLVLPRAVHCDWRCWRHLAQPLPRSDQLNPSLQCPLSLPVPIPGECSCVSVILWSSNRRKRKANSGRKRTRWDGVLPSTGTMGLRRCLSGWTGVLHREIGLVSILLTLSLIKFQFWGLCEIGCLSS